MIANKKMNLMCSMNFLGLLISILLVCASCSFNYTISEEEEKNKILELHQKQREYHFNKMAEEFASQLSSTHISVNRGEINMPSKESNIKRFSSYFNSVEFEKWDDVNPPIVRFSDDYKMAYTIVNKEVVVKYSNENEELIREKTEFSWVAIYRKYDEGWKIDCVASTNKPSVSENMNI